MTGNVMTGNVMTAKSEVLDLRELSPEELDAVSGGWGPSFGKTVENQGQLQALETFRAALYGAQGI